MGRLLGAYSYDQAGGGIGMPYSALRYTETGKAAQTLISAYTSDYQPTVSSIALPKDLADQYGLEYRYTYTQTYTDTGLPHSTRLPAVGTLPAEEVITRYNEEGLPESVSGHDWYGSQTLYSPYGQLLRSTLGDNPYRVWSTASFDEASGELTGMETWREQAGTSADVTGNKVSDTSYTYEVTFSDPTGLSVSLTSKEISLALEGAGLSAAMVAQAKSDSNRSLTSVILSAAGAILRDYLGVDGIKRCIGGSIWACAEVVLDNMPFMKALKAPRKVYSAVKKVFSAVSAWRKAKARAKQILDKANAAIKKAKKEKQKREERRKKAAQAKAKKAAEKRQTTSNRASQQARKTGNSKHKSAQASAAPRSSAAASSGAGKAKGSSGGGGGGGSTKKGGSTGASSRSNSGTSGGGTRTEKVTAEIKGEGLKHLVKITLDTDGPSGNNTSEITATDGHPFWVPALHEWTDATDLKPGQWLRTSAGTHVQITAIKRWTSTGATVHNLTVSDAHTYYVLAGAAPVLVHNCGVTRGGNESTYSISHDASGSGVIADLDSDGILTMMMHNNPDKGSPLRGKAMFDEVMGHFGDRVQGIQGIWVYGDNLGGFNEAVRGGASLVSAAKGTWTGRQAARYGFTRARIDEAVPRLDGDFQQVLATFRR